MSSNVPEPSFGPNGWIMPTEEEILAGVTADINNAMGGNLNPGLTTPQGQIASTETAIIGDKNAEFAWFTNQVDPAYNEGRMQDAIARIYFITRNPALPTVVQCTVAGLTNTPIPIGALARDTSGNIYVCQQSGTIPIGGSIVLPFANQQNGPIPCAAGTLVEIYQAITGWESITNAEDGVLGVNVESPREFESRRAASVALNSIGAIPSVLGAILAVFGVLDAYVIDNSSGSPVTIGGVTLSPHSIYAAAVGGSPDDVAFALWTKKSPGCDYNGNTTITVTDPSPLYNVPPTYDVTYEIPTSLDFFIQVKLANNKGIPSNALTLIQTAIVNAFAGVDGGSRARIGSTVFASRYYGPVAMLGSWAQIISILVGATDETATYTKNASFKGTISANVLTASGVTGTIKVGDLLADTAALTAESSYILSQLTGSPGSDGTYSITEQPNVGSPSFTGVIATHVLTASAVTGTITPGMLLQGTSVGVDTFILAQLTGTIGGAGTYSVTLSQADVGSESMTAIDVMSTLPLQNDITANINQAPALTAAGISLIIANP